MPPTPKNGKYEKMKNYKNENGQKHISLVNLGLREYQNRIQHVHKSAHAKYELCSCPERRVRTIGSCESKVACKFFIVFRVFECLICNLF